MKIAIRDVGGNNLTCFQFERGMGTLTIGRSSKCDVKIPEKYGSISGIQACLRRLGDEVQIMDGDGRKPSSNGTFINGQKLPLETWVTVSSTDSISLGVPNANGSVLIDLPSLAEVRSNLQHTFNNSPSSNSPPLSPKKITAVSEYGSPNTPINSVTGQTLSDSMRSRLNRIDHFLRNGYNLKKEIGAFPVFVSNDGRSMHISFFRNPAGFSWIGFFFPFAVCTQIREWSYFYVVGLTELIASIISIAIKWDISGISGFSIGIAYGIYLPYLRHMSLSTMVPEIRRGPSIILGLCLAVLASIPSAIVVYFFLPS
jgi:hypothetical protein